MSGENPSTWCVRFVWKYVRKKGKYGLDSLDAGQKKRLEKKLREYEGLTLHAFRNSDGVCLSEFNLKRCKKAPSEHQQMQVREELLAEVDELGPVLRFRVSDRMRVVGYRKKNRFFVIWVDARHEMG